MAGNEFDPTDPATWQPDDARDLGAALADEFAQIIGRFIDQRFNVAIRWAIDQGADPTPVYAQFAEMLRVCADRVEEKAGSMLDDESEG